MTEVDSKSLREIKYVSNQCEDQEKTHKLQAECTVKKSDTLFLFFTVITEIMLIAVGGAVGVWTSPVIPKLKSNNTEENPIGRPVTTLEISMIAGLPTVTLILGALLLGNLSEMIGRKKVLQIVGVGMFLAIAILAFSRNIYFIIISRCIIFFCFSGALTVTPIYLTEICEDHNRARYGCIMATFLPLGSLYGYALGSLLNVRLFTLMIAFPLIFFIYFFLFAPESPVYTLVNGRKEECIQALRKLRSDKNDEEIEEDLAKIEATINSKATGDTSSSMFMLFATKERRYAMMLAIGPPIIQFLSGAAIILQFLAPIFIEAGTNLDANHMSIAVGLAKFISFLVTALIVERTGRRSLLLISSVGSGIPLMCLGGFFYLKHINSPLVVHLQWLPLTSIIGFVVIYALGLGPISTAIMGELFTPDMRAAGVSFIMTTIGVCLSVAIGAYPFMVETLGIHWCMWLYGSICFAGAAFIFFMIPETKGKSIIEIQEYIKRRCNT